MAARSTTIKLSTQTRDRLREMGGETYEDTIVEALDALDAQRFWDQAEAAAAWRAAQPADARDAIGSRDRRLADALDAWE